MMNKEMQVCNLNGVQGDKVSKILNHKHQEVVENGGSNSSSHDGNNTFTKLGNWGTMSPSRWQDTMYGQANGFFMHLWKDTLKYIMEKCKQYCGNPADCIVVEVGCGTGDVILGIASEFCFSLGMDINEDFIEYCRDVTPRSVEVKAKFVQGCVTHLSDIVREHTERAPNTHPGQTKVVVCVNNTLGIFPDAIKDGAYRQMHEVAGEDGIIIVGFWNGKYFGEGIQHFYNKNPVLCGSLDGARINWDECILDTKDGYHTKWTEKEEVSAIFDKIGFKLLEVIECGRGVLCVCRGYN
eukprot:8057_1